MNKQTIREVLKELVNEYAYGEGRGIMRKNPTLAIREALAAIEVEMPRWISVSERLPEAGWYLVYNDGEMQIDHFMYSQNKKRLEWVYYEDITHWQPLPEPPQSEAEEGVI